MNEWMVAKGGMVSFMDGSLCNDKVPCNYTN